MRMKAWAVGGGGTVGGVTPVPGGRLDKINIWLQTSIGVLRIEGAALDPPILVSWNPGSFGSKRLLP